MSLRHRYIYFWILSGFCFFAAIYVTAQFKHQDESQAERVKPFDITTAVEAVPGRYFQTNGQYHLDMQGRAQIILPLKHLPDNLNAYNFLVINQFNGFQIANVYLTAQLISNQHQTSDNFKQKLISSQRSINQLDPRWHNAEQISDVAIVIEPEVSLGFNHNSDDELSWQSIQFTNSKQVTTIRQIISELSAFVPLNYSSINVHNGEIIDLYKLLLIWVGVWLLISIILFYVIKPDTIHLFMSIALAWLVVTIVYGHNFAQQTQFNQPRFADNSSYLNQMDYRLSTIANRINQAIISNNSPSATAKIMIIGDDDFDKKRLNFHLLQHNVGIIDDFEALKTRLPQSNHFAVLLPPYTEICATEQQSMPTNILLKTTQFCLLQ